MKVYVGVETYTDESGHVLPRMIYWTDGRRFEIQKILDERRGNGIRYTCLINGHTTFLFFEDPRWFVDAVKN